MLWGTRLRRRRGARSGGPAAEAPVATSFLTLAAGTAVVDRVGRPVGTVCETLLHEGGGFDGIIVRTRAGRRFIDAPEVRRISNGAVTLGVTAADIERPAGDHPGRKGVPGAREDSADVTEADRDAAIGVLKRAYVRGELTVDALGDRVAAAHLAEAFDELEEALRDVTVG